MIKLINGSGETNLRTSFMFETLFERIVSDKSRVAECISKLFGAIEDPSTNNFSFKVHKTLLAEDAFIEDILDDGADSADITKVMHRVIFDNMTIYIRLFHITNFVVNPNHVGILRTDDKQNHIIYLTLFLDYYLYKNNDDHYIEKLAVYTLLKNYMLICLEILGAPDLDESYIFEDNIKYKFNCYFYKALGEMYRHIISIPDDQFIESIFPDHTYTHSLHMLYNRKIKNAFNGKDF